MRLLVRWLINAVSLLIVAYFVSGFEVHGIGAALIAAAIFGVVNATLGLFLKVITFPLTILSFGLFLIAITAIVLNLAPSVAPGFAVHTWTANPGVTEAAILSRMALITMRKRPKLRIVNGKVMIFKKRPSVAFTTPKIAAAMSAAPIPCTSKPLTK